MKEFFEVKKPDVAYEDINKMTPKLIIVLGYFLNFAEKNNLPVRITNIKHKFPQSKSNTHPSGRAFDVSVRNWPREKISECEQHLELEIGHLGAVSASTLRPNLVVFHDVGLGEHFHIQVSPASL